jgi:hypothetical protein
VTPPDIIEVVGGALVVTLTLYDLFDSIVLPRPSVGRISPSLALQRRLWLAWRWLGTRPSSVQRRETVLAVFAPLAVLVFLVLRGGALIVGYALIYHGIRGEFHPQPHTFGTSVYFSAAALLALGAFDLPASTVPRILVSFEAATGLGLVAVVIAFLFSVVTSFQRRETAVVTLDALAGAPPSGVQLLENCAHHRMPEQMDRTFEEWRQWSAEVLESHLAYPVLTYFRSSHDNEAWVNSFGAVMDAAVLVLTTVEGCGPGPAQLMFKVGGHLVEDMSWRRSFQPDGRPWLDRGDFDEACRRLGEVGYRLRDGDEAWREFARHRSSYASPLIELARHLAIAPAPWIGDRSYLPHVGRTAR